MKKRNGIWWVVAAAAAVWAGAWRAAGEAPAARLYGAAVPRARAAENLADALVDGETWVGVFEIPKRILPISPTGENREPLPGLFELRVTHGVVPLRLVERLHGDIPGMVFMTDPRLNQFCLDCPPFPFQAWQESRWILSLARDRRELGWPEQFERYPGSGETIRLARENAVRMAGDACGAVCLDEGSEIRRETESSRSDWRERMSRSVPFGDEKTLEDLRRAARFAESGAGSESEEELEALQTEIGAAVARRFRENGAMIPRREGDGENVLRGVGAGMAGVRIATVDEGLAQRLADARKHLEYSPPPMAVAAGSVEIPRNLVEAAAYLNRWRSSYCHPPVCCAETADEFWFSGGITSYPVPDFGSGLAVRKADGAIGGWWLPPDALPGPQGGTQEQER